MQGERVYPSTLMDSITARTILRAGGAIPHHCNRRKPRPGMTDAPQAMETRPEFQLRHRRQTRSETGFRFGVVAPWCCRAMERRAIFTADAGRARWIWWRVGGRG
jgi:hypothetical protein